MPRALWIIPELAELEDQTTAGDHIVLSAVNRRSVIGRPACIEIADLASEPDESPELDIDTTAVIEGGMIDETRGGIGASVQSGRALLIDRPTGSDGEIRGHTTIRKERQSNTGRQEDGRRVSRKRLVARTDLTKRVGKEVNLSIQGRIFGP